jgi:hypothetical protein
LTVRPLVLGLALNRCAFGLGALWAIRAGDRSAPRWMAAHALADASDLAATLAARSTIPKRNLLFASVIAGASTAVAVAGAATDPAGA